MVIETAVRFTAILVVSSALMIANGSCPEPNCLCHSTSNITTSIRQAGYRPMDKSVGHQPALSFLFGKLAVVKVTKRLLQQFGLAIPHAIHEFVGDHRAVDQYSEETVHGR